MSAKFTKGNWKIFNNRVMSKCGLVFTFNFTGAGHVSIDWSEK